MHKSGFTIIEYDKITGAHTIQGVGMIILPEHVAHGEGSAVLGRIHEPHINLAIWHRTLPSELRRGFDRLDYKMVASSRFLGRQYAGTLPAIKQTLFQNFPVESENGMWRIFIADVLMLTQLAADIMGNELKVDVRRELVGSGYKFHVDGPLYRLITTYRGRGTLWLPDSAANKQALRNEFYDDKDIVRNRNDIRALERGDVAVLKGAGQNGLVHQSPRVRAPEEFRIVVVINR